MIQHFKTDWSLLILKSVQVFEGPSPQSDNLQLLRQEGASPIITINEPDKVSRLGFFTYGAAADIDGLLRLFIPKVVPCVNRSGRMNLFSLMQSISELDDMDNGHEPVNKMLILILITV